MIERYEDQRIAEIWSRSAQIRRWAEIETAWAGQYSDDARRDMASARPPFPEEVAERERETRHEFVAFLDVWSERFLSEEAQRWLHYGLTSSDVIDTATAIALVQTHDYLSELVAGLQINLIGLIEETAGVPQIGRTHGQWASTRAAVIPLRALWWTLHRQAIRLDRAARDLVEADFSGPVGNRAELEADKVVSTLKSLGLVRAAASTQILPRDGWEHWAHCLAMVVTSCEAIADHYWFLAQSEVGEVRVHGGAGSSAMPHKRGNPHIAENIRGLARMARAAVIPLAESLVQRGDRDLAHSSVERVLLPDLCHLAATAVRRTVAVVGEYQLVPERMALNVEAAKAAGAQSAALVMQHVRGGATRTAAIATTREGI